MYNASSQGYDRLIIDSMVPQSPHVALEYTGVLTMGMSNPIEQALERSILDQDRLLTLPEIADFIRVTPHALHMQRLRLLRVYRAIQICGFRQMPLELLYLPT